MKAEGDCPDCGKAVGVHIAGDLASMFKSSIEQFMGRDGNAMRCSNCGKYVEPAGVSIEE
jgi:endogenous inhibitor of DNA gyrase (YacG/DUF329 family)